jgi:hypothetical protein
MALEELREALTLLKKNPLFLGPGAAGGIFIAILWLSVNSSGAFLASRLFVIFALVFIFLTTGMFTIIKTGEGQLISMLKGGVRYYFRVLLPQLVIVFTVLLVFILCMITFSFAGLSSDVGLLTVLTFAIMVPTLILTSFFDTAAVFEDRHVFESVQRSIILVSTHMSAVISFFVICAGICAGILFGLMILWEAILFDKLKPIMDFTDAQREAFTPDQLVAMIGPEGLWVTALVLFIAFFLIIPIVYSYKAVFFRKMASSTVLIQQQTTGEYDSKGRWYKY